MTSINFGFFDELRKLAATADELVRAAIRMNENSGTVFPNDLNSAGRALVFPPQLDRRGRPKMFPTPHPVMDHSSLNVGHMITPEHLNRQAIGRFGVRDRYFLTSPPEVISSDAQKMINHPDINLTVGGSKDQHRRNLEAKILNHEAREGRTARRVGAHQLRDAAEKVRPEYDAAIHRAVSSIKYDKDTGERLNDPVIDYSSSAIRPKIEQYSNSYASHLSPMLTVEDLRQAYSMGRSSELAKSINSMPEMVRKLDAHRRGLGREHLAAKLRARKSGDPNWRDARSTDANLVSQTDRALTPQPEPHIIFQRKEELSKLPRIISKSAPWINDPRVAPYLRAEAPFPKWMRRGIERAWENTPALDRALEARPDAFFSPSYTPRSLIADADFRRDEKLKFGRNKEEIRAREARERGLGQAELAATLSELKALRAEAPEGTPFYRLVNKAKSAARRKRRWRDL